MRYLVISTLIFCLSCARSIGQERTSVLTEKSINSDITSNNKPKLVVGIVIDQMRWDFLHRFESRYGNGGFKRLMQEGFNCANTMIPYATTVTAAGHTTVYTGSVPSIHGIVGNEWYSAADGKSIYCAEDSLVNTVGSISEIEGKMSPRNMFTTSICDEIRLASNFKSKSIGVCIKDRGAIFPAGHSANAAYWYDSSTGNWITSSFYTKQLPQWLEKINADKIVNKYYKMNWATLYPKDTYINSTSDEQAHEGRFKGNPSASLPYRLDTFADKNFGLICFTPHGTSMTIEVAKAAIENHDLGQSDYTDFLALSLSSPDYTGHQFGPNSVEIEDTYLRLDRELEQFLNYLDKQIGMNKYTIFLTADHGVAHIPGFLKKNKIPADVIASSKFIIGINEDVKEKFGISDVILSEYNYQLYLNKKAIKESKFKIEEIQNFVLSELKKFPVVADAFLSEEMNIIPMNDELRRKINNSFNTSRSGDIFVILKPGVFDGRPTGTTHGSWYPYDSHIPLLWYGAGINKGKTNKTTFMTDIAPTLAALLNVQMPNGCIGNVIEEVIK